MNYMILYELYDIKINIKLKTYNIIIKSYG